MPRCWDQIDRQSTPEDRPSNEGACDELNQETLRERGAGNLPVYYERLNCIGILQMALDVGQDCPCFYVICNDAP
jgi:hypothetical protein